MTDRSELARAADVTLIDLRKLLDETPDDAERATALARRIGELRAQEIVRLVRSIAEVRKTLTPDQRVRLKTLKF